MRRWVGHSAQDGAHLPDTVGPGPAAGAGGSGTRTGMGRVTANLLSQIPAAPSPVSGWRRTDWVPDRAVRAYLWDGKKMFSLRHPRCNFQVSWLTGNSYESASFFLTEFAETNYFLLSFIIIFFLLQCQQRLGTNNKPGSSSGGSKPLGPGPQATTRPTRSTLCGQMSA